ncbi:MAG: TIGR02678 family protein [Magnetospirillum sp.]|nr:TIGR02678 family protein [Magnetospirillum sp.]
MPDLQQRHQQEEFRGALRALLMVPLMPPTHPDFIAVRRQQARLQEWIARETGWVLQVEREGARLYKRPADVSDATRGLPEYDRQRYAVLCLVAAVLERAEPQITLRVLGEKLLSLAAEPNLAARGFVYPLTSQGERRDLVVVCRTLLALGILQRVAGDEDAFIQGGGPQDDALYDVHRRALAGLLAAVRGPSTWPIDEAPATLDQRLAAMVAEYVADSDEGRRTALRHRLARRMLDDPVVYFDDLGPEELAYFTNQRGTMASRLCEGAALAAEQRGEGLALTDEAGELTDIAMPAEGTDAHATLLVAEYLAHIMRSGSGSSLGIGKAVLADRLAEARDRYGRYWRKSAREAGGERDLVDTALSRLEMLRLIRREGDTIHPLPALARFALGEPKEPTYGRRDRA